MQCPIAGENLITQTQLADSKKLKMPPLPIITDPRAKEMDADDLVSKKSKILEHEQLKLSSHNSLFSTYKRNSKKGGSLVSLSEANEDLKHRQVDSWLKESKVSLNFEDDLSYSRRKVQENEPRKYTIRLNGSINGCRDVGLTRLQFFDYKGQMIKIDLCPGMQTQANCMRPLANLLRDNPFTRREEDLFLAEFPLLKDHIDIQLKYVGPPLALVRAWNYNADPGKGARELEILQNGESLARDYLKPANMDVDKPYHQDIKIDPRVQIPGEDLNGVTSKTTDQDFDELFNQIRPESTQRHENEKQHKLNFNRHEGNIGFKREAQPSNPYKKQLLSPGIESNSDIIHEKQVKNQQAPHKDSQCSSSWLLTDLGKPKETELVGQQVDLGRDDKMFSMPTTILVNESQCIHADSLFEGE